MLSRFLPWFVRAVLPPLLLVSLLGLALREPVRWWLHGEEIYDQEAIREWVREARISPSSSLPELIRAYVKLADDRLALQRRVASAIPAERDQLGLQLRELEEALTKKREVVEEYLRSLGN